MNLSCWVRGLAARRRLPCMLALILAMVSTAAAADSVLILGPTVETGNPATSGANSLEAKAALALGYTVDVVDNATWGSLTPADFKKYRAIILGDPNCGTLTAVSAAVSNANVWGPLVNGNVIIINTDPVVHQASGGKALTEKGIEFAADQPGKTGAYITLSCYYDYPPTPSGTVVPLLDGAFGSGPGSFKVTGFPPPNNCYNNAYITASHPVFTSSPPLTSTTLSNWGCSVHEAFELWPLDFVVLAIAKNFGSSYIAPHP